MFVGYYGNGFKLGFMRFGKDVIVFIKIGNMRSVGFFL